MNRTGRNKPTKPTIETSRVAQHETGCWAHVLDRAIPCIRLYVAKNEASDACFTENRMLGRQQHDASPFLERGSAPEARPQLRLPRRGGYLSRPSVADLQTGPAQHWPDVDVAKVLGRLQQTEVAPFQWTVCQLAVYVLVMAACMSAS